MAEQKRIVFTSGSWDLFHVGHLNILEESRKLGDVLVVGVSTDALIEDYKGLPPIIPFDQRCEIVGAMECVDCVVQQDVLTDIRQLIEYKVDVVVIGDDWKDRHLAGLDWMQEQGKEVVYLPYTEGVSTTQIKRRIIDSTYDIISAELQREYSRIEEWKAVHATKDTGE